MRRLNKAGYAAYPVGGCVRDLLLRRRIGDWDLTTNARPEQVAALFAKVIPTGIEHGTVTVLEAGRAIEVTTYRGEVGYSDGRRPDKVIFLDSLEEDLKRRDFTINAMALDLDHARVVDPYGGRDDLKKKCIRAVGQASHRFAEDGLRPMRALRFATVLDFEIIPETFSAIGPAIEVFRKVAAERVRVELLKILESKHAARGIELLRSSGLLAEILPELLLGLGHAQNRFHPHDIYQHGLHALEKARGDAVLKLAVLLHDVGKPECAAGPEGEHTFYGHEQASARLAESIMKRLRFSKADRERVIGLISHHMFHYEPDWTDGAVRRLVCRVGRERLGDLWEMRQADARGRGPGLRAALANLRALRGRIDLVLEKDSAMKITDLAIDGAQVMKFLDLAPGPEVGQALDFLLEKVLDEPELNQPLELEKLLRAWRQ
ncbi:MAG: HD domain-containing protein [Deltaproteobacteria bacterium]|nr:HD domain-containing protein [Deltaproteobacteria bacterium]